MKLLLVEDEKVTSDYLRTGLSEEGYTVDVARSGQEAEDKVTVQRYDLILLDVMLPGQDGFALCRRWRASGLKTPVLFVTARDSVRDRVEGLELGGDDYLIKPFAFEELLARVRALLRRPNRIEESLIAVGRLTVDPLRRLVTLEGRELPLSHREFQILERLARSRGQVVSRTVLWEAVWETDAEPQSNVVDVYIGYLRKKLGSDAIQTVRGAGYKLVAERLK